MYTNMYEEDLSRHAHCTCASHVRTCHDTPTVHVHHIIIMRSLRHWRYLLHELYCMILNWQAENIEGR